MKSLASFCVTLLLAQTIGLRYSPTGGSGTSVLQPGDIEVIGAIRPPAAVNTVGSYGNLAGRVEGDGHVHLYMWGNAPTPGWPNLYDLDVNGLTPNPNYASAPAVTSYVNCGQIMGSPTQREDFTATGGGGIIDTNGGINTLQTDTYWNDSTSLLYWTYRVIYGGFNRETVGATAFGADCSSHTGVYGPFTVATTMQDGPTTVYGTRAHFLTTNPLTGKMATGGTFAAGNAATTWGPSWFDGLNFFTSSTTPSAAGTNPEPVNSQTAERSNFYTSAGSLRNRITAAITNPPLQAMQWNCAAEGLYYNVEPAAGLDATRVDPALNSGNCSWGDYDWLRSMYWFNGTHKQGIIYMASMAVSTADTLDCDLGEHEWYANNGNGQTTMTSCAPSANCQEWYDHSHGHVIHGNTSGKEFTGTGDAYILSDKIIALQQYPDCDIPGGCTSANNFTVGETIEDLTSHETAVVSVFRRYDVCNHGCSAVFGATGPSASILLPIMIIMDPADFAAVAANTKLDYTVTANSMTNLKAAPYAIKTCQTSGCTGTYAGADLGCTYFNPATNYLYCIAHSADDDFSSLIWVLHINDTAPPAPSLLSWLWSLAPSWLHGTTPPSLLGLTK